MKIKAVRSYATAARAAEQAGERVLAIESWRTAGQLAAGHGHADAMERWEGLAHAG